MMQITQGIQNKKWVFKATVLTLLLVTLPFFMPEFWIYMLTDIMAYCIFALGYNIVLGYGGMMAFGHAGFYGAGAYFLALALIMAKMPFWAALVLAPLFSSLLGAIIGFFSVRRRAFYLAMLTMAFGQLIWSVILKWYNLTGGENGITGIPLPNVISTPGNLYFFTLVIMSSCTYAIYKITDSPFGRILQAMRENPQRMEFTGVNLEKHKLIAFVISTFFAGLGGTMHAVVTRCVFPDLADWAKSGEVMITCMLGGMHTFFGPIIGVALLFFMHTIVGRFTAYWAWILGVIFILLALFLPEGILGFIKKSRMARRFQQQKKDR
jgi:branched-chain amino acid transport system permease protein